MNRDRVAEDLRKHEGYRGMPYRCPAGKLTIGVGRNLDANGLRDDEIELMLNNDIDQAIEDAKEIVQCFERLDSVRQEVLVNMAFNLGRSRLAGFKKMIAAIEANKYAVASVEMMDSQWADQVGPRAQELAQRMATGYHE